MGNLVFPLNIAGAQPNLRRAPMFSTGLQTAVSGAELRASWESFPRYKYTLGLEVIRSDAVWLEFQRIASFFCGALGKYDTFLIQDPNDSVASNMGFGVTDGSSTAYQLQRTLGGYQQSGYWDPTVYPINTVPRANYLLQSQTIDNATWTKSSITINPNALKAPDGTATGDGLVESTSTSVQHYATQTVAGLASTAQAWTVSCYVAASTRTKVLLQLQELTGNTTVSVWYDLTAGTVGTIQTGANWSGVSATITPSNGPWFRLTLTATKTNAATSLNLTVSSAAADAVAAYAGVPTATAINLWGTQLEIGNAVTGYLPTLTSAILDNPAYWPGFGDGFEPVTEINTGTLQVSLAGSLKTIGTDFTYLGAGSVNFSSTPASGQNLTWSGSYFRRVRFLNDELELERIFGQLWMGRTVEFMSVK